MKSVVILASVVGLLMALVAISSSGMAMTYNTVNSPSSIGSGSISAWQCGSTWGGTGIAMMGGTTDDMLANPNPTFAIESAYNNSVSNWNYWPNQTFPPNNASIVNVKVIVVGSSALLNEGWLSFVYTALVPYSDKPWLASNLITHIPWHNSTVFPLSALPTVSSRSWTVTNMEAWTPAMLRSSKLYVMWTQLDSDVYTHTLIDYVGLDYTWVAAGGSGMNPDYGRQHNWTPSPYNFGGWLSPGLFIGLIGGMGLIGMVATPIIYMSQRESEDGLAALGMTIFIFVLSMGFFWAWIAVG